MIAQDRIRELCARVVNAPHDEFQAAIVDLAKAMQIVERSRIMVVDDEPSVVSTVCMLLEANGFSAVGANSGDEALEKAAGFAPQLLLSDVMMPGKNGFDTAREVKALVPDCCLLFFTAYGEAAAAMAADLQGCGYQFEVLAKPIHPTTLIATIKAALDQQS